jgi:hypothetical protein
MFNKLLGLTRRLRSQGKDDAIRSVVVTQILRNTTKEDVDAVFLVGEGDRFVLQNVLLWPVMNTKAKENNSLEDQMAPAVGFHPCASDTVRIDFIGFPCAD